MKKIWSIILITVALTACKPEDTKIQGRWRITAYKIDELASEEETNPPGHPDAFLTISENTYAFTYSNEDGSMTPNGSGTWEIFGGDVIEFSDDFYCGRFTIVELSSVLKLKDASVYTCSAGFSGVGYEYMYFEKQ